MKPILTRLRRYLNPTIQGCLYCCINASLGNTSHGLLGCIFCQKEVDDYVLANFNMEEEDNENLL